MKIDERHLIQLAAVVKTGGVTEGAALLGMAQPAVSRTLSMLEKRLGEPLFLKGRRPLQPTPLGRALADHGQTMLAASRKASDTIESFRVGKGGTVRIGGTPFFMDALIAGMIAEFQNQHPDVRIDQIDLAIADSDGLYTVAKVQAGYTRYLRPVGPFQPGVGAGVSVGIVPETLKDDYGTRANLGAALYLTLRPAR